MSEQAPTGVFVGIWTNWSKGQVLGATLTIRADHGLFLVAFLALFVRWAGSHVWGIVRFLLHQSRSTLEDRDGFHHQLQVLLRAALSELTVLWRLTELVFAWRAHTTRTFGRIVPLFLITALHVAVFSITGIFSSRVTTTDGEVLVKSDVCGWLDDRILKPYSQWNEDDLGWADAFFTTANVRFKNGAAYVRSCYGNEDQNHLSPCQDYVLPSIRSSINRTSLCPFTEGTCFGSTISIDSGLIDSATHLGINNSPENRVQFRKITSCASIPVEEKYGTNWTSEVKDSLEQVLLNRIGVTKLSPNDLYKYFSFGESSAFGSTYSNFTFAISQSMENFASRPYNLYANFPYGYINSFANDDSYNTFMPNNDLKRVDADVTMILLNNLAAYTGRTSDLWFQTALEPTSNIAWAPPGVWAASRTISGIGCVEQYQFCNRESCIPLSGYYAISDDTVKPLNFNPIQHATFRLMLQALRNAGMQFLLLYLGSDVLLANDKLFGGLWLSTALQDNQWQIEMEHIHNIGMALLQMGIVEHAYPLGLKASQSVNLTRYLIMENNTEAQHICVNQKIRSTAYSSFSLLGILIILCGGFFFILVQLSLPWLVHRLRPQTSKRLAAKREWNEDDIFQLQRIACEGRGIGPWKGKEDHVPFTARFGQKFCFSRQDPIYHESIELTNAK